MGSATSSSSTTALRTSLIERRIWSISSCCSSAGSPARETMSSSVTNPAPTSLTLSVANPSNQTSITGHSASFVELVDAQTILVMLSNKSNFQLDDEKVSLGEP